MPYGTALLARSRGCRSHGSPSCNARRWPLPHSLYRAAELRRVEEVYFTAEELEALDAAQKPAAVTPERKLQIIEEMGKQMGDLGKREGGRSMALCGALMDGSACRRCCRR